jgi:hypothetical protein
MRYRQIGEKFDWLLYLLDHFNWSLYFYGTSYLYIIDKNEKKAKWQRPVNKLDGVFSYEF